MKTTKRTNIHDTFNQLFRDMEQYYASLNEHSIWLFIVSLGCWSIPASVGWLQVVGIVIVLILFAHKLLPLYSKGNNATYPQRYAKLKDEFVAKYGKGVMHKVYRKRYRLTYFKAWVFWVCLVFACISGVAMIFHLIE